MRSQPRAADDASALTFLGDVFPKDPFIIEAELPGSVVLNLEAPLTHRTRGYPGKINLRGSIDCLRAAFDPLPIAVSLANNHILDFYGPGLADTVAELKALGIAYCGAGTPEDSFKNPAWVSLAGTKVALLGYADESSTPVYHTDEHPGAARLLVDDVIRDISAAKREGAQRVVVMAHWGQEQVRLPSLRCIEMGRAIIDAGADLVIGHHAHCIQSFEEYGGKHIFYGLGNCVFPAHASPSHFNAEGVSTRNVDSRPAPVNRMSLAVTWDPVTADVKVEPLYFERGRLRRGRFEVERYRLDLPSLEGYEQRYRRAYNRGKLRHTLARFFSKPKLPTSHHLRAVLKLVRSRPPQ